MRASNFPIMENTEIFSVATMLYTRLRRVTGRVVDVAYLIEHSDYALHVCELALASEDEQLCTMADQIKQHFKLDQSDEDDPDHTKQQAEFAAPPLVEDEAIPDAELYRAQVHHHYIGALR